MAHEKSFLRPSAARFGIDWAGTTRGRSAIDHHDTPVLAPGETNGPPGFVGIGVQKAGTSWWYRLVVDHPQVSHRPSIHKERHFFARFGTD